METNKLKLVSDIIIGDIGKSLSEFILSQPDGSRIDIRLDEPDIHIEVCNYEGKLTLDVY